MLGFYSTDGSGNNDDAFGGGGKGDVCPTSPNPLVEPATESVSETTVVTEQAEEETSVMVSP